DLLLRNDGDGVFTDVSSAAGLGGARPSLGCAVADFDNDHFPDILITGAGQQRLFRNKGDGTFEDVTTTAGLDKLKDVCLGCAWVDLEQDADLDMLIARCADTPESAVAVLSGQRAGKGGLAIFLNIGKPGTAPPGEPYGPLSVGFIRAEKVESALNVTDPIVTFAVTDAD